MQISYHFESYIFNLEINKGFRVKVMVLSATFNNISVTSWPSVLLVEENGVHREKHGSATNHWQTL
jgi:hypothetical protein